MGRPSKCRICGYRFHAGEDICPECFTARDDDISCEQFGQDEHTHSPGFSTTESSDVYDEFKERSFIDEQRSEEAHDPIPSATYGGRQGTPPPTYAQQSYQQSRPQQSASYGGGQTREDKLAALRNAGRTSGPQGTGYDPRNVYFGTGQPVGQRVYYTRSGQKQKANSAVIAAVVILFLCIFFVPFIIGMVSALGGSSNRSKTTTTARKNIDVSLDLPDLSLPDISIPDVDELYDIPAKLDQSDYVLTARHITVSKIIAPEELEVFFSEDEIKTHRMTEGHLPEGYRCMTMELSSISKDPDKFTAPDIAAFGCYLETYSVSGDMICTSYCVSDLESGISIEGMRFIIPSEYSHFKLYILADPENGDAAHKEILIRTYNIHVSDDAPDESAADSSSSHGRSGRDKTA